MRVHVLPHTDQTATLCRLLEESSDQNVYSSKVEKPCPGELKTKHLNKAILTLRKKNVQGKKCDHI